MHPEWSSKFDGNGFSTVFPCNKFMSSEKEKAPIAVQDEPINVRVALQVWIFDRDRFEICQDGTEVFFKIKKQTPLQKLMDAFCAKNGIQSHAVRFLFDGQRIQGTMTAKQVL